MRTFSPPAPRVHNNQDAYPCPHVMTWTIMTVCKIFFVVYSSSLVDLPYEDNKINFFFAQPSGYITYGLDHLYCKILAYQPPQSTTNALDPQIRDHHHHSLCTSQLPIFTPSISGLDLLTAATTATKPHSPTPVPKPSYHLSRLQAFTTPLPSCHPRWSRRS